MAAERDGEAGATPRRTSARRWRWSRARIAWAVAAVLVLVGIAYLASPAALYRASKTPFGAPAGWDQPVQNGTVATASPAPAPKPTEAKTADTSDTTETPAWENDTDTATNAASAAPPVATAAAADASPPASDGTDPDIVRAIDRAREKALRSGEAARWEAAGREGYVVPSEAVEDARGECRNLVVSVVTAAGQPQSSRTRFCRDGDGGDWHVE